MKKKMHPQQIFIYCYVKAIFDKLHKINIVNM